MFGKILGSFMSIGDKLKRGFNIGKKVFRIGKSIFNSFFNTPSPSRETENEKRLKNTYSLEQRIIADKTPSNLFEETIENNILKKRLQNLRDSKPANKAGYIAQPIPKPPQIIDDDIFKINLDFMN